VRLPGEVAKGLPVRSKDLLSQLAKTLCLPYYAYVFSSTKLEIRAEQVLPGSGGEGKRAEGRGDRGEK
jgi:hypothetical protein